MNKFDQHIKEKLSQQQVPPLDAWKNIQEKLDEKEKKRRIIPLFYWIGSTAACIILGVGVFYFNQEESSTSNHSTQEIVKNTSNSSLEKEESSNKNNSKQVEENHVQQNVNNNNNLNKKSIELTHKETKQENKNYLDYNDSHSTNTVSEKGMLTFDSSNKSSIFIEKDNAFKMIPEEKEKLKSNTSLFDPLSQQNNLAKSTKDSITKKDALDQILNEKPLELVLEEEQKEVEKEKENIKITSPKFIVSSYVNPTKMLDSKSILSDEFNQNNINNSLTVAYGAKVAVRVNDRINIRSGVSKIELEQQTSHVGTMGTNAMNFLANSNINLNAQNNIRYEQNYTRVLANSNVATMLSSTFGEMEQKIHYVEIPLEMEYKLTNFKKFNLVATAGGSYYLVTKNEISLKDSNARSVRIGEASNLNNTNYSANAGLKLEYLLSEKTSINLEPNYRYMINTLHNVETKNPSLLGINLGFSIKF